MPRAEWCEILDGRDFFSWNEKVDWIVTNPPWSLIRTFLRHAMEVSDNVVFLLTINHIWTKARIRDIGHFRFGIKEIVLVDMPKEFPQSGFQLGAVHISRGWTGAIKLTDLTTKLRIKRAPKNLNQSRLLTASPVLESVA